MQYEIGICTYLITHTHRQCKRVTMYSYYFMGCKLQQLPKGTNFWPQHVCSKPDTCVFKVKSTPPLLSSPSLNSIETIEVWDF